MVKGPSHDYWIRDTSCYHKFCKNQCKATEKAQQVVEISISCDEMRQFSYWLILFPKPILLDNCVFSKDKSEVDGDVVGVQLEANNNDMGKDLYSAIIYWRIAKKDAGKRIAETKQKRDPKSLFI